MTVADVTPTLKAHGVTGIVLVQAADTAADTKNMLAEAAAHPLVRGIVGWANLAAKPEAFAAQMNALRQNSAIVGVRNLMHVKGVSHWILGQEQQCNVAQVAAAGLPLDVVTSHHTELGDVVQLIDEVPGIRVVVDHLGKPPIGGSAPDRREWRARLAEIAANPNATAKVSGLSSSVGPLSAWTVGQVTPFIHDALELFGPHRLMYGGDWPVVLLAGGYERAWKAVNESLKVLTDDERTEVLEGTAARAYGI
jgi:L-fuconolactonase